MLKSFLYQLPDHRNQKGKRYEIGAIWLSSILAVLSGANSYRKISKFIKKHYARLEALLEVEWKHRPSYTTIRAIIQATSATDLEACFREYSASLAE